MRRGATALLLLGALAAGCGAGGNSGGSSSSAPPSGAAGREPRAISRDPALVAALGDSITAGSPLWDPVPAFRERITAPTGMAPDERSQWGYWFERADPRRRLVRNCGVSGERTDEIAVRLADCAAGAGALVIQGGINDIAQGRDVADAAGDLEAMVRAGRAGGRTVALVEVLPWNNGYPAAAPRIDELNDRIRALGKRERVPVLRWYEALEDPAARGRMRPDLTIDGNHPSIAGYRRLAGLVMLP